MKRDTKKYLHLLAKNSIAKGLSLLIEELDRPNDPVLGEKRGVFVTLEIFGRLRGCIGNIMPVYPLEEAVDRNAMAAAFDDPRFEPLTVSEFENVDIEISVLTVPEKLEYGDVDDLLRKLVVGEDGVVLKSGYNEATYLPQVWDEIGDKENFLSSLCVKAGLSADQWREGDVEVFTYRVEKF